MKKTLLPQRRDLKSELMQKKKSTPRNLNGNSISVQKNLSIQAHEKPEKQSNQSFEGKYRNKNLTSIPAPLLVALSALTTVDVSCNHLNDSQIQLLMNSCTRLNTLCIQGNVNTLIPASIWKLKELVNFRHDWLKIISGKQDCFECEKNLKKLQYLVQKPSKVVKINRVVGLNFQTYCNQLANITLDGLLIEKVEKSNCSDHAKLQMIKVIKQTINSKMKQSSKGDPLLEKQQYLLACTTMCGFDGAAKQKEPKASILHKKQSVNVSSIKDLSEAQTDCGSHKIKIQDIRDISEKQSNMIVHEKCLSYHAPGFPLHQLFANYDSNPRGPADIDKILLKGYNPNQYDPNGLSPYHVCVIQNQKKGFNHLIDISANNPGFFDLEMASQNQGRNILHYCVFLKNYSFSKQLIQFGFPLQKRDSNGARIIHLVDQNYEFMLLLRKLIKKGIEFAKNKNSLNITNSFRKKYAQHPQRLKQQSKFRITYSKSEKLMQMYENAVGLLGEGNRNR